MILSAGCHLPLSFLLSPFFFLFFLSFPSFFFPPPTSTVSLTESLSSMFVFFAPLTKINRMG